MRWVIFDLDDTLYDEATFVASGFNVVAATVAVRYGMDAAHIRAAIVRAFAQHGRGETFTHALDALGIVATRAFIAELVEAYRSHHPDIAPFPGIRDLLVALRARDITTALVTDTHWRVQERKVLALGIAPLFNAVLYTNAFGWKKPMPAVYDALERMCGVQWRDAVVVGDDPTCDFVEPNRRGARTVRLALPGCRLASLVRPTPYAAQYTVITLPALTALLAHSLV